MTSIDIDHEVYSKCTKEQLLKMLREYSDHKNELSWEVRNIIKEIEEYDLRISHIIQALYE